MMKIIKPIEDQLTDDEFRYLYAKLQTEKIPEPIREKVINVDQITDEEAATLKKIIAEDMKSDR